MKIIDNITRLLFERVTKTVFWRIDNKKRLILFGHGGIPGYAPSAEYIQYPPWKEKEFDQVIVGRGITDIHPMAFLGIDLEDVILEQEGKRGDGLEINEAGLYNRFKKELLIGRDQKRVVIPNGTVDISPFAFAFHQKIEEIVCPFSLQRICVSAFEGAKSLKYIYRIPSEAIMGIRALNGTTGVKIYYDKNPVKRTILEMYPRTAITKYGRAFLMNGEFTYYESQTEINIDPTKFYRCKNLVDIKGGEDFLIGLCADGAVIYEKASPALKALDYQKGPFQFAQYKQYSCFDKLREWKNIREIAVAGNIAAGLCEDGRVFCTASNDENQPIEGITDAISMEVKDGKIYIVRADWTLVRMIGKGDEKEDEECLLYF